MKNQGWECPKCGTVYAPWVPTCRECPKGKVSSGLTQPVVIEQTGAVTCHCPTTSDGLRFHRFEDS